MEILSISIDKEELKQLEEIQKRLGFKSRSKMLRNAIMSLQKDYGGLDSLKGEVESVFVLTYDNAEKNHVSNLLHRFEKNIKTELHQHHHTGTCIDILNIEANAKETRELYSTLKANKCVYSVNYSIINEKE